MQCFSTKSDPRKDMGTLVSLMHIGSESLPIWPDPIEELLPYTLLNMLIRAKIESYQKTQ